MNHMSNNRSEISEFVDLCLDLGLDRGSGMVGVGGEGERCCGVDAVMQLEAKIHLMYVTTSNALEEIKFLHTQWSDLIPQSGIGEEPIVCFDFFHRILTARLEAAAKLVELSEIAVKLVIGVVSSSLCFACFSFGGSVKDSLAGFSKAFVLELEKIEQEINTVYESVLRVDAEVFKR